MGRIMERRKKTRIGRELGLHLNAVLRPIGHEAIHKEEKRGGAYVAAVSEGTGLQVGDVILGLHVAGKVVDLDSKMRVDLRNVWKHGRIDFRAFFDNLVGDSENRYARSLRTKARVKRGGEERDIFLTVGPNEKGRRRIYPDC